VPGWIQANIDQGEAWGWYLTLEREVNEFHQYTPGAKKPVSTARQAQA
jgi:hypothetical protein